MAVINIVEKITKALDDKLYTSGIFVDLSKAFDTANHEILLSKLPYFGILGVALNWFNSYLCNRRQYAAINDVVSAMQSITCGVPHGSVLGPVIFLLYINDITESFSLLQFDLFVDDINLFYCNKSIQLLQQTVNTELDSLLDWFSGLCSDVHHLGHSKNY